MKFTIDQELIKTTEYSLTELVLLFLLVYGEPPILISKAMGEKFIEKGLVSVGLDRKLIPTPVGRDLVNTLLFYKKSTTKNYNKLAATLQELYPAGRKGNTAYYWRGTVTEVAQKLKTFFTRYPKITEEQVIIATRNYVSSFKGDTTYMQLLKYFIEKNGTSALLSSVENIGSHSVTEKDDWTSTIV